MIISHLSLHGEGPGHGGAGEDAPDVEPCRLLDRGVLAAPMLPGDVGDQDDEDTEGEDHDVLGQVHGS